MSTRKQIQAVFFSVIMVMSVIAIGAGGGAAQPSVSDGDLEGGVQDVNTGQESTETTQTADQSPSVTAEPQDVEVADGVRDRGGTAVLLVSVDRNIDRGAIRSGDVSAETLQADSEATLSPVADQVNQLGAAEVRQQFWVSNTLSVEIDLDRHSVEDLTAIEGVSAITPNVEVTHPTPPSEEEVTASVEQNHTAEYTYGLEQIDISGFEEKYGDRGGDATVTVIDDGVSDPDNIHPDLEFAQTAIASDGEITTGTLGGAGGHGEHVAGTISGAAEPAGDVPRYGVAPNSSVIMINAFEGGATLEDILTSVEYSVEQDSDVTSMSLGFSSTTGFSTISNVVENTMQDANAAGTLVTVSAGNSGAGDAGGPTSSPGAEFSSMAIGASNDQGNLAAFSSGDIINPNEVELIDEDGTYPANYPRQYVKPDVAAPGAAVLSTGPLGTNVAEDPTYSTASGTSMAAPHVAGAATILQSMTDDDLDPKLIEMALAETAEKPDNDFASEFGRDIRYGTGIINITAAADALMSGSMTVSGTVTDGAGDPIQGASVSADSDALTSTNASGSYTLHTTQDEVDITVDAFGYDASTQTVSSGDNPVDFTLEDATEIDLLDDQSAFVEFGGQIDVTVDVRNLEGLTVDLSEETNVSQDDLTLLVNGNEETFGDSVALDGFDGTAEVSVDIADSENLSEGQVIGLEHTFEGIDDNQSVETGPTTLTEELEPAFFELSNLSAPSGIVAGNAVPVSVEVTNTGQELPENKGVQFFATDGETEITLPPEQQNIAPGETKEFSVAAAGIEDFFGPGSTIEHGVRSGDITSGLLGDSIPEEDVEDTVTADLAIQAENTQFDVTNLDAPTEVEGGESVTVNATINNVGEEADEQDVEFRFENETLASESVDLNAFDVGANNTSADVSFTVTAPAETGFYTHGVFTDDDSATATLAVGQSLPTVTVVGTSDDYGSQTVALLERGLDSQPLQVEYADASSVDENLIDNTSVFVFHNLGGNSDETITAVENDPTTTAVYLEQFSDSNAIAQRSDAIGDPESSLADFDTSSGTPVEFEITQDHPLFEGVGETGDRVVVHTASDSDHAYFEGADGETLAEVGIQGQSNAGPVTTVDPDSGSVLLGTIAPNTFEAESDFTDDAAQILANSVTVAQDNIVTDAVSSTSIDAEFIGTVDDAENITVSADGFVSDGEVVTDDTVTFTVGDEPVATADVDNGSAEATFDPQTLDADAGETLTVSVEEYGVVNEAEVDTVDETADLADGFNLLSVPQAAELSAENVSTINTWNSSAGSYDTVTASTFDSADDLNNGLYVSAAADDARLGFTFSDDVPVGGTADINSGWNLVGSNFPIDSPADGDNRSLDEDLIEVNPDELTVFDAEFNQQYDGNSTIGGYEAYWAFNDEDTSAERAIISPSYEVADREGVLGIEDSDFEVTNVDATVVSGDEVVPEDDHNDVLTGDERVVEVDVTVTNNGGLDTQFVDLEVGDERVDRSLGVTLAEGGDTTQTLYYELSQDDVPSVTVEGVTEDTSATASVDLGDTDGLFVQDQALTLDDEFVVSQVDYNGEATIEVASNDTVIGSTTVADAVAPADDVIVDVNASQIEDSEVEVRLLNADGEQETNTTAFIDEPTIDVSVDSSSFAFADEDSSDVTVTVDNNALIEQTPTIDFAVAGDSVGSEDVEVAGDSDTATSFTVDTTNLSVGDSVEYTASSPDDSASGTLTVAESALTFNDQSVNADDEVLVEDVTASADQTVVITDTDLNPVGEVNVSDINEENILVDISTDSDIDEYIAHVVAQDDDVADEPGLVNDQATIIDADVTVEDVEETFAEDETAEVSEVIVQTADVIDADTDGTNFGVEIYEGDSLIGESDALDGSNSDVTVALDTALDTDSTSIEAVLVDENDAAFQEPSGAALVDISDDATVDITVDELPANVELPDQEINSYNGNDSVLVTDVTGDASQYVVITDSELNIVGTHALESDVASEDIEVALDESVEPGEYRAHLTSDVSLIGQGGVVTDAGVLVDASVTFTNQSYVDDTETVTIDSASVDDGLGGMTEYSVKLHEVTESGGVGGIVGSSEILTGAQDGVLVSLDAGESIQETGEYVAMLHFDDGSPIGESPVTDRATVTIEPTDASYQLSDLEPADATVETGETFSVSATVTNTGDLAGNQTIDLTLDDQVVASETDVEIAGSDSTTVTFEGISVSEVGEYTHTVASEDDSVSGSLTAVAEGLTFSNQSATDGQVLVENVTTVSADQKVVITDSEFEIVGQSDELGMVVQDEVLIDLDEQNPTGEYIAHVVANASNADGDAPGLVTDQATLVDADVAVDNVSVAETEENLSVSVDEITVQTANVTDAEMDGTNFAVEIRQGGEEIGASDTLNGSNSDVQVSLDDPIEVTSTGTLTEDITAVLVDETGAAFQEPDVDETAFQDVSDDATVSITVSPADASVSLPDQEIGTAGGSDAVYANNVTGTDGQFVVITDGDRNIIGSTELTERAAGDQVIVELDETVTRGQYRAHLTTDVGLLGGDALITDSGELYDAQVSFDDREFVGATSEVTVATAELLDGGDNTTDFAVAIHEGSAGGDIIGNTTGLTGTESNVDVTLNADESISENGDYVAMLHFEDEDGGLGAPIQAVEDTSTVGPVTDSAEITSIEGALNFNDQSFNATDGNVVVEDVQANETSTLVLTYMDADGNQTIAGIGTDSYENATPNDLEVSVDNASGFPGEHTAHLIPTDGVSDLGNYSAGDEISDATVANITTSESATVFETALTIDDQSVEDATSSVEVATADLFDDVDNGSNVGTTGFAVAIHENGSASGDIIGSSDTLTANNSDVTVNLTREINSTEDVVAMLHVSSNDDLGAPVTEYNGSSLVSVTDNATVTVQQAEGGNVDLSEQAIGTNGEVIVENVTAVDVVTVDGDDPTTDAFDPADDFLVLTDGESVADGSAGVIDSVQLSDVSGDVTLNASGATAGEHTVVLHEPNADGDGPDPAAPRTNASSGEVVDANATIFTGDVAVSEQTLVEGEDNLAEITLDTAELDDGSADGATFTVVVENTTSEVELGNETFTGSTTTVTLDEALPRGDTDITVRLEQDGAPVEQASGTSFATITDSATVTTEQSQFDLALQDLNGAGNSAEIAEGTQNINVTVDVTNNGDFDDAQVITAEVIDNGTVVASDSFDNFGGFQVQQGETRTLTLNDLPTADLEPGDYDVNVSSDDDQVSSSLTVLAPNAQLEGLDIGTNGADAELTLDQPTENIDVTVNNTGDIEYDGNVTLTVSNASGTQITEEQAVTVTDGTTSDLTFNDVVVGNLSQGEYDVTVASDDATIEGTLTVLAVEVTNLQIDSQGSSLTIDEGDGPVTVSADLTNFGDDTARDVTLTVGDGELTDTSNNFQLSSDETRTLDFSDVAVETLAAGDYNVSVATPQTDATGTLQVDNLAVDINTADSDLNVIANETAVVNTTLTNEGDSEVTQTIELNVTGVSGVQDSQEVTVGGGNSTTIDLSYQTNLSDDGADVIVTSVQDSAQESLSVQSLQSALPADDGSLTLDATTYAENITISANNTTITGAGVSSTTIDGNVTIDGDNNTIEDLTIEGNLTDNGQSNSVGNADITSNSPGGSIIIEGTDASITSTTAENVTVNGSATISGSTVSNNNAGTITVTSSGDATVSNSSADSVSNDGTVTLSNTSAGTVSGSGTTNYGSNTVQVSGTDEVFNSVQNAVSAASAGATVTVQDGTYDGKVILTTEGLTLEGPNAGTNGNDTAARSAEATLNGPVFVENDNITVNGFEIKDLGATDDTLTPGPGVVQISTTQKGVGTANGTNVSNNIITANTSIDGRILGVSLNEGADNVTIDGNLISGENADGVVTYQSQIDALEIKDNEFQTAVGVITTGQTTANISGNSFIDQGTGIGIADYASLTIENNNFTDNGGVSAYVVDQTGGLDLSAIQTNNTFSSSSVDGNQIIP